MANNHGHDQLENCVTSENMCGCVMKFTFWFPSISRRIACRPGVAASILLPKQNVPFFLPLFDDGRNLPRRWTTNKYRKARKKDRDRAKPKHSYAGGIRVVEVAAASSSILMNIGGPSSGVTRLPSPRVASLEDKMPSPDPVCSRFADPGVIRRFLANVRKSTSPTARILLLRTGIPCHFPKI